MELGAMKIHERKLGMFDCSGGKMAFAMAGNSAFAISAIQKCERKLAESAPNGVLEDLEVILDEEYRRVVFSHPGYPDVSLAYWFLIAFWSPGQSIQLLATHENTLRRVIGHECLGIGQDLAQFLIAPAVTEDRNEHETLLLASYMLAKVKEHVPGCGGPSQFLAMRNDGTLTFVDPFRFDQLTQRSAIFDSSARRLFFLAADDSLTDSKFEDRLAAFAGLARTMRSMWQKSAQNGPSFKTLNPEEQLSLEATKADP